ncbi:MAG: hypothetical protein KDA96_27855, partial [Planctomycetaceae bacterium]|nr:hypothetical protein [Planctomycetaceae bacterium]
MEPERLRREIAFTAAQLLHSRRESVFIRARWRAVRAITRSYVPPDCIPTDMEIRAELQQLTTGGLPVVPAGEVAAASCQEGNHDAMELTVDQHYSYYRSLLLPLDRV